MSSSKYYQQSGFFSGRGGKRRDDHFQQTKFDIDKHFSASKKEAKAAINNFIDITVSQPNGIKQLMNEMKRSGLPQTIPENFRNPGTKLEPVNRSAAGTLSGKIISSFRQPTSAIPMETDHEYLRTINDPTLNSHQSFDKRNGLTEAMTGHSSGRDVISEYQLAGAATAVTSNKKNRGTALQMKTQILSQNTLSAGSTLSYKEYGGGQGTNESSQRQDFAKRLMMSQEFDSSMMDKVTLNKKATFINRNSKVAHSINGSKLPNSLSSSISALSQSKSYYMKFIHEYNKHNLANQQRIKNQFIPQAEAASVSRKDRFKRYMKILNDQEVKEQITEEEKPVKRTHFSEERGDWGSNMSPNVKSGFMATGFISHKDESADPPMRGLLDRNQIYRKNYQHTMPQSPDNDQQLMSRPQTQENVKGLLSAKGRRNPHLHETLRSVTVEEKKKKPVQASHQGISVQNYLLNNRRREQGVTSTIQKSSNRKITIDNSSIKLPASKTTKMTRDTTPTNSGGTKIYKIQSKTKITFVNEDSDENPRDKPPPSSMKKNRKGSDKENKNDLAYQFRTMFTKDLATSIENSPEKSVQGDIPPTNIFQKKRTMAKETQDKHAVKVANDQISEAAKKLSQLFTADSFIGICGENEKRAWQSVRLSKARAKHFLSHHFGSLIGDKLSMIFDFSQPIDFYKYIQQVENLAKDRGMLLQIAFDIFDSNGDGHLTQLDLFKVLYHIGQGPMAEVFNQGLYYDFCQISEKLTAFSEYKRDQNVKLNEGDELYLKRVENFRNLTLLDQKFIKQKEKVMWPLFEYRPQIEIGKMKKELNRGVGDYQKASVKKKDKKFGKNPKLFNALDTYRKRANPLVNGKPKDFAFSESLLMSSSAVEAADEKKSDKDLYDVDSESDNPENNKDFFEQMTLWQMESSKKMDPKAVKQAKEKKELRKHVGGQNNAYSVQKSNKKPPNLQKLKPVLGGKYPTQYMQNLYLFKQNPILEDFMTNYVENTQQCLSEHLTLEQFMAIPWKDGLPQVIILLLQKLIGKPQPVESLMNETKAAFQKIQEVAVDRILKPGEGNNRARQLETFYKGYKEKQVREQVDTLSELSFDSQISEEFPPYYRQLENEINLLQKRFQGSSKLWNRMVSAFKTFSIDRERTTKYLSLYSITEQSLKENFKHVFGTKCDFMEDLLYTKLANKKNFAKINFSAFARLFMDIIDDSKDKRNRAIFNLLEQNNGGQISVVTMMDLQKRVDPTTPFGKEIQTLITEYKYKNILMKEGFSRKIQMNFATFNRLIPYSCLVEEFQFRIFGVYVPEKKENMLKKMRQTQDVRLQRMLEPDLGSGALRKKKTKDDLKNEAKEQKPDTHHSGDEEEEEKEAPLPPPLVPAFIPEKEILLI